MDVVQEYVDALEQLDPEGEFAQIDPEHERVHYHDDIEVGRSPKWEPEELSRAYIVAWLCTEGGYEPSNLFLEKPYSIGRPSGSAAFVDIVIRRYDTEGEAVPYMLIEAKTPSEYDEAADDIIEGQLFAIAQQEPEVEALALATADPSLGSDLIRCMTVDNTRYPTFDAWKEEGRPHADSIPRHFARAIPEPLTRGGDHDLREDVTLSELDTIWRRLHNLLWGGYLDDNDAFEWVCRMILAKIYDEKTASSGEPYEFQIMYSAGTVEPTEETFERIDDLYRRAVARYLKTDEEPEGVDGIDTNAFDENRVRSVVKQLQEISLTPEHGNNHAGDLLGRIFGQILRQGFKQSKGLYLTNPTLISFVLRVLNLGEMAEERLQQERQLESRLPYIIDPSCGSGTFLVGALNYIQDYVNEHRDDIADNQDTEEAIDSLFGSENQAAAWAGTHLYGVDPHKSLPIAAKINMILHQDGSGHIFQTSSLLPFHNYSTADDQCRLTPTNEPAHPDYEFPVSEGFDVVVSNPPFSIDLSNEEKENLGSVFEFANKSKSENLFFERWYQLLEEGGRLGVVLPESFFSVEDDRYIRHFAMKYFNIKAIVHLPEHAFQPYTTTLTSLLFAQKKTSEEVDRWTECWEAKREALDDEVDEVRKGLYKSRRPSDRTEEEKREWLEEQLNRCEKFLDDWDEVEIREAENLDEGVEELRRHINKYANNDNVRNEFLLKQVCTELNYSFPVITVGGIGYSQTTRATHEESNELMVIKDGDGNRINHLESIEDQVDIQVDTDDPETALDYLRRDISWD